MTSLAQRFTDFVVANRELINTKITAFVNKMSDAISNIDLKEVLKHAKEFSKGIMFIAGVSAMIIGALGGVDNAIKFVAASMVAAKIAPFVSILSSIGKMGFIGGVLKTIAIAGMTAFKALIPLVLSIGLVPLAIAAAAVAIAAGVYWIVTNFDKVKAFAKSMGVDLDQVWATVKTGFTNLKNAALVIWNAIRFAISDPMGAAKAVVIAHISGLKAVWTSVMTAIANVAGNIWESIKAKFLAGVTFVKGLVNDLAEAVGADKVFEIKASVAGKRQGTPLASNDNNQNRAAAFTATSAVSKLIATPIVQPPARVAANGNSSNVVTVRTEKGTEVAGITGDSAGFNRDGENFTFGNATGNG